MVVCHIFAHFPGQTITLLTVKKWQINCQLKSLLGLSLMLIITWKKTTFFFSWQQPTVWFLSVHTRLHRGAFSLFSAMFHRDRLQTWSFIQQWIRFPHGSISQRRSNVRKSVWCVTLFDSPAYGVQWVLISTLGLYGSSECHICHVSCLTFCRRKTAAAGGGHLCLQCVCVCVCVCVCEEKRGCSRLSFVWNGATWAWIKPYLRGFRTDGVPLFQDVCIIRKWGERWKRTPPTHSHKQTHTHTHTHTYLLSE